MRKSIMVTTFLVTGAGAAGASAAMPTPYQGSDTEFHLTTDAIAGAHLLPANAYIGGGSGNAAAAMTITPPTQYTGPMSRMMKKEGHICNYSGGTNGSTAVNASGIVLGLDAVDILSSTLAGGQPSCNGTSDNNGTGLIHSGSSTGSGGDFAAAATTANPETWKWALALVYGGKDLSVGGAQDCNSTARHNLVNNWTHLFQAGCTMNSSAAICADTDHHGMLWHAFRRDDVSGTSDVFSSLLGISPSTSGSALNGFGASPFCNAMNWDTAAGQNGVCALGNHMQFVGPGGIPDTAVDATGAHKQPPPNTWGTWPDPTKTSNYVDVLPTQMQDNDPIRRKCIGTTVNSTTRAGEEVCNIDGNLGLVIPMPDSDWMLQANLNAGGNPYPLKQYPTNTCNSWAGVTAPRILTCAPQRNTTHLGQCPNGDAIFGSGCLAPIDTTAAPPVGSSFTNGNSQCVASNSKVAPIIVRDGLNGDPGPLFNNGNPDGRAYNLQMRDGNAQDDGTGGYAHYNIAAISATTFVDFAGGFSRIHEGQTMIPGLATACQLVDMTDNIGCLAAADPCSIGFAGDGSKNWTSRSPINLNGPVNMAALRVAEIAPTTLTVQLLGQPGEYQAARKLYFSSFLGFQNIPGSNADELTLANWESTDSNINPLLGSDGFFTLGNQSPNKSQTSSTGNAPFCEDFNEDNYCNGGLNTGGALGKANTNGCLTNSTLTGIPAAANTVCGDGTVNAYEECDDGALNGVGSDKCSVSCRCTTSFIATSLPLTGSNGCQ